MEEKSPSLGSVRHLDEVVPPNTDDKGVKPAAETFKREDLLHYIFERFLEPDRTFRDPIHFDIIVNHLESRVIDTKDFQRLRRIRQLGTAHLVYHGAEHSRFQHSLGTLAMAAKLIETISKNLSNDTPPSLKYRSEGSFWPYTNMLVFSESGDKEKRKTQHMGFLILARLSALLHDMIVTPFSHTLEKEGGLVPHQWEDKTLVEYLFNNDSKTFLAIKEYTKSLVVEYMTKKQVSIEKGFDNDKFSSKVARDILDMVIKINKQDKKANEVIDIEIMDLKLLPVASQIVGDTICADLLDYIQRDLYFCGIQKKIDDRFMKYACLSYKPDEGYVFSYRVVNKHGQFKSSIISGLLDVIDRRFDIAELVHMHKAKNGFSAAIIEAFNIANEMFCDDNDFTTNVWGKMNEYGDDELLRSLRIFAGTKLKDLKKKIGSETDVQSRELNSILSLIDNYESRKSFYPIDLGYEWPSPSTTNRDDLEKFLNDYLKLLRDPKSRLNIEKSITEILQKSGFEAQPGDILLYSVPDPETLNKPLNVYVMWKAGTQASVAPLKDFSKDKGRPISLKKIPLNSIEKIGHKVTELVSEFDELWKVYVFLSPSFYEQNKDKIDIIETIIFKTIDKALRDYAGVTNEIVSKRSNMNETVLTTAQDSIVKEFYKITEKCAREIPTRSFEDDHIKYTKMLLDSIKK